MLNARSFRCFSLALVFALLLAAPWPVDAKPSEGPRAETKASPIHLFLDWLEGLWSASGCTFDPGGICRDGAAGESPSGTDNADAGCTFDPSGVCRDDG